MTKRSPVAVILLTIVTLGIYGIYWEVKTKNEMNAMGANIPTALLIIIPVANIFWMWKFAQGVELVTRGKISGILAFLGFWLVGFVMAAIVQDTFNNLEPIQPMQSPMAPMAPTPLQ